MKIGIPYYTLSGHTQRAASRLETRLKQAGHDPVLIPLELVGPHNLNHETAELRSVPSLEDFDAVAVCSPVRGGTLPSPVARYLENAPGLAGKRTAAFLTHFFPAKWGADQTAAQIRKALEARDALFCGWREARWFVFGPGRQLDTAAAEIAGLLES